MLSKILVPTDFSHCAEAALEQAAWLAKRCAAELVLFHVRSEFLFVAPDGFGYASGDLYGEDAKEVEKLLAERATRLRESGAKVRTLSVIGNPYEQIVELAVTEQVELIVMGTHGRGALGRMMMGSVAERVARTAKVPVMTVRAPEHAQAVRSAGA